LPLTHEQISERGAAAKTLLGNDTFNAVLNEMLAHGYGQWLATNEREIREREEMHAKIRAIQAIRDELRQRVDAATKQTADLARREQRKKEI